MRIEAWRLLSRPRAAVAAALASAVVTYWLFQLRPVPPTVTPTPLPGDAYYTVTVRLIGAISYYGPEMYIFAAPVIAAAVSAGSMAADRSWAHPTLVLIRGFSRARYVLGKAAGMAAAAALATFASYLVVFMACMFFLPWGELTINNGPPFEPFPRLFAVSPLFTDLAVAGVTSLAAAALALSGLVVGALVANEYIAAGSPAVIALGSMLAGRSGPLMYVSPVTYLSLTDLYPNHIEPAWRPYAAPAYWLAFAGVCVVIGLLAFRGRESD